jgi:hypothetical protein
LIGTFLCLPVRRLVDVMMVGRMLAAALGVVSVLLGVTVLGANGTKAAAADNQPAYMEVKNAGEKTCLGGELSLGHHACNGEPQKWAVEGSGPLKVIRNKATGRCLTSKWHGEDVPTVLECKPGDKYQQWKLEGADTKFLIADSGKCLEIDWHSKLFLSPFSDCICNCTRDDWSKWTVDVPKAAAADNHKYLEFKNAGARMCLDGGKEIYPHACNNGDHQKWAVEGSGPLKTIRQKATGRCLSQNGNGSGKYAYLERCDSTEKYVNLKWKIEGNVGKRSIIGADGECLETDGKTFSFSNCADGRDQNYRRWVERAFP